MSVHLYSEEEERQISVEIFALTDEVRRGDFGGERLDEALVLAIHRRFMACVRPEGAGRMRSAQWGVEYLEFGPNRSTHRKEVPAAMAALCERARAELEALSRHRTVARSVRFAAWVHAEIVRIHPFFDGNGRTSRFVMNIILEALGVGCVAVEAVKREYNDALNAYFAAARHGTSFDSPALDALVRVMAECFKIQAPQIGVGPPPEPED